jgi:hypothetical protein
VPILSQILFLQIWRLKQAKVKIVALQLPEGLQLFACTLADIIGAYADVEVCQSCCSCKQGDSSQFLATGGHPRGRYLWRVLRG